MLEGGGPGYGGYGDAGGGGGGGRGDGCLRGHAGCVDGGGG